MSDSIDKLRKQNKKLRKEIAGLRGDMADLYNLVGEIGDQVNNLHGRWGAAPKEKEKDKTWDAVVDSIPNWAKKIDTGFVTIQTSDGQEFHGQEQPDGSVTFGPMFPDSRTQIKAKDVQGTDRVQGVADKIAAAPKRGQDVRSFTNKLDDPCTECGAVAGVECPVVCPRMERLAAGEEGDIETWAERGRQVEQGLRPKSNAGSERQPAWTYGVDPSEGGGIIGWDPVEKRPVQVRDVTPNRDPEGSEYTFWFTEEMCEELGIPNIQRHLVEKPGTGGALEMVDGPPVNLLPEHREIVQQALVKGMD